MWIGDGLVAAGVPGGGGSQGPGQDWADGGEGPVALLGRHEGSHGEEMGPTHEEVGVPA